MRSLVVVLAVIASGACKQEPEARGNGPAAVTRIRVAAAANLSSAFTELGKRFHAATGIEAKFDFGASGLLARQIKEGAPMDVFASANEAFVDDVLKSGKCDPTTKVMYARAPIVLWVKAGGVAPPAQLADLADPRFATIAIANPETAPYGKAAKQALEKLGLWSSVGSRVKYAENIGQTLQYAQSGNVEAAFVALSLVVDRKDGTALPVPPELHDPIDQAMVVCGTGSAGEAGRKFADFVVSEEGRAVMTRYGYTTPGSVSMHR
jgi:molybdate transport system substrate-binding protein